MIWLFMIAANVLAAGQVYWMVRYGRALQDIERLRQINQRQLSFNAELISLCRELNAELQRREAGTVERLQFAIQADKRTMRCN